MIFFDEYFKKVCKNCDFPEDAKEEICKIAKEIDSDADFSDKILKLRTSYMFSYAHNFINLGKKIQILATEKEISEYSLNLVFLIICSKLLLKRYIKYGYEEELFWDTIYDLKYKLLECIKTDEIFGIKPFSWYEGFYNFTKFSIGRFQYEETTFHKNYITKGNMELNTNTPCLTLHIPSSGIPLSHEVRIASYKKAYEFYKNSERIVDGNLIIRCDSWLLFPKHTTFLPEQSNILSFMSDFDIFESREMPEFKDAWRIFGRNYTLEYEKLPEHTSLQKAYKNWLLQGNYSGKGTGVIVFDGEKIINTDKY